ncbi:hypothetical protein QTP88_016033 [Uroleucon formosanum]
MLRLSYFPTIWKHAVVIVIPKAGKPKNLASSYRPISLLPTLGKLFEKLILLRIRPILHERQIISTTQFGFRPGHSTIHQIHRLIDSIASALEKKQYCAGLFLDVAQAFDKVWHDGLLFKLKKFMPAQLYLVIKSFLENRSFSVRQGNFFSPRFNITAGVPQGSDLAPDLYNIYTADIPQTPNTLLATFADDTALLSTSDDIFIAAHNLQHHTSLIDAWCKNWLIKINESKSTQYLKNYTVVGTLKYSIEMGQSHSAGGGAGGEKKDDKDKKKKYEPPIPTRVGKKKKRAKGPDTATKLPIITPHTRCRLKLLKLERVKDYLMMEEEFILNQERLKPQEERNEEERSRVDDLRGSPMSVGTLEEIIDDNHAIVSTSVGSEHYVSILSFVDKDQLEPGCSVLLNHKVHAVVGVLSDDTDPMVTVMKLEKAPQETYGDIGGLDQQIQEIKESVELPLTHPEYYEEMGIKPPKGVILYGPPGTGKTLLAKAVANQTSATFLRVVGSELIQKYLGDGPKLVRELFRVAEEHAPSIVFIDEIDAVGTKRYDSNSGGEREIQRTMLELLNQLDGFDSRGDVKVVMATNRIETLDPALIRPGRIDRKIEFPLPDEKTKRRIFNIHTSRMTLAEGVNLQELIMAKDDLSGADIKAICTEAGLMALRERRMKVTNEDFKKSKESVLYRKKEGTPEGLYL